MSFSPIGTGYKPIGTDYSPIGGLPLRPKSMLPAAVPPWRMPSRGHAGLQKLNENSRTRQLRMSAFRPTTIATPDGRLVLAPAMMGTGQQPTQGVPGDSDLLPPHVDDALTLNGTKLLVSRLREDGVKDLLPQKVGSDAESQDEWYRLPLVYLMPDPATGFRTMIQGREVGYTEAVPFQVPRLISGDGPPQWLCIGGVLPQFQSDQDIPELFTIPTTTIQITKGYIGFKFDLFGGPAAVDPSNPGPTLAHWIEKAEWATLAFPGQVASTLGAGPDADGNFAAGSVFCPVFYVDADAGIVRNLGLQIPSGRQTYWMTFNPSGAWATVL